MDKLETVARALCAEKCAFMGERPCYSIWDEWPNPNCQEPGCRAEAKAAIAALEPVTVQEVTTQRALEIVLSRCKMDNGTAHVLKGLLGYARLRALAERGE